MEFGKLGQEVTMTIDSLGAFEEALEEVLGMGADGVASAKTQTDDQEATDNAVLKDAIKNARSKAEDMIEGENQSVGKIVSVEVIEDAEAQSYIIADKMSTYQGLAMNKMLNEARVRVTFELN